MELAPDRSSWYLNSRFNAAIIVFLVAVLSYVVSELGNALSTPSPNALAALAGLCASGVSLAAGLKKDVADSHRGGHRRFHFL